MAFDVLLQDVGEADVGRTPQRECPVLADLTRQLHARPVWMMQDAAPIEVDAETWKQARAEMVEIQKSRGFPLATAHIDRRNFLLHGIPVVVA